MNATEKILNSIKNSKDPRVNGVVLMNKETNKSKLNELIKHLDEVEEAYNVEKSNKMNE